MTYSLTVTFEELSCEIIRLRLEDLVSRGLHGRDRCVLSCAGIERKQCSVGVIGVVFKLELLICPNLTKRSCFRR